MKVHIKIMRARLQWCHFVELDLDVWDVPVVERVEDHIRWCCQRLDHSALNVCCCCHGVDIAAEFEEDATQAWWLL